MNVREYLKKKKKIRRMNNKTLGKQIESIKLLLLNLRFEDKLWEEIQHPEEILHPRNVKKETASVELWHLTTEIVKWWGITTNTLIPLVF